MKRNFLEEESFQGYFSNFLIFNSESINDMATFGKPPQSPKGILPELATEK